MGTILAYKGAISNIPEKWALCDGNHGTPNLTGRFLEGVTSSPGNMKSAGLPNITGTFSGAGDDSAKNMAKSSGAFYAVNYTGGVAVNNTGGATPDALFGFNAHYSHSIYGNSSTVQPASYTVLYIMKIKA